MSDGRGSLGLAYLGLVAGARVLDLGDTELRTGLGGGALLWTATDLDGSREVWSGRAGARLVADQGFRPNAAAQAGLDVAVAFQEIDVVGSSEAPSSLLVRVFLGIRVGR